jgi:hypothetical protein
MLKADEHIYFIVTSPYTVKFGASSSINSRQKAHYTSSPFLKMHGYKVNDAARAEAALHKLAEPYRLKHGDIVNNIMIGPDVQLDEHYRLSERDADQLCRHIQQIFPENRPLDYGRTHCVECRHVVNESTVLKNDGFRCKRCYQKLEKYDPMEICYDYSLTLLPDILQPSTQPTMNSTTR